MLASTGYGLGDWFGIAATEDVMARFADQATTSNDADVGQPIGLALTAAKRQYFYSLSSVNAYDEKASIDFTLYGMPQYRLPCKTHPFSAAWTVQKADTTVPEGATFDGHFETTDFNLDVLDTGANLTHTFDDAKLIEPSTSTQTARYITVDGDAQATVDRPIEPRMVINLGPAGDNPVTAAVVTDGTYTDYPDFDRAITCITAAGYETSGQESLASADGWSPASPVTVTTNGTMQQLVVTPGQSITTDVDEHGVVVTQRVWKDLKIKL